MTKEELLARRWMLGTRKNSTREAWRHPEDIAREVERMDLKGGFKGELIAIAWLHDILEDGIKEDRKRVTKEDLQKEGVYSSIIGFVDILTRDPKESKRQYLSFVLNSTWTQPKIIKVIDRIVNLEEGIKTMPDEWVKRYKEETRLYFLPLLPHDGGELRSRLYRLVYR